MVSSRTTHSTRCCSTANCRAHRANSFDPYRLAASPDRVPATAYVRPADIDPDCWSVLVPSRDSSVDFRLLIHLARSCCTTSLSVDPSDADEFLVLLLVLLGKF